MAAEADVKVPSTPFPRPPGTPPGAISLGARRASGTSGPRPCRLRRYRARAERAGRGAKPAIKASTAVAAWTML
jgi:hypothetical protein